MIINRLDEMFRYVISQRKFKRLIIYFIFLLITLQIINLILNYLTNYDSLINNLKRNKYKSVQLLTGRFHFVNWKLEHELGDVPFKHCAEKRCYAYRSLFQHASEKADGVMVHAPNLWYMPSRTEYKRNRKQLWLFYTLESQGRTHCSSHYDLKDLDDWFNITATFKSDSDLIADYKEFRTWKDIESNKKYIDEFNKLYHDNPEPEKSIGDFSVKNKKASVAWFVSHCGTQSRREDYVEEMQKYIDIDVYGKCGDKIDPCIGITKKEAKEECFNEVLNSYKFYLSFENCLCTDYVTEKYWQFYDSNKIFNINTLPIVRGAQESYFQKNTIPHSFINAQNFKSPKELANYLNYLNQNETAYLEYFNWKVELYKRLKINSNSHNVVVDTWNVSTEYHLREPFCKMCSLLHNETYLNSNTNRVWKLSDWFGKKINCWDEEEPSYFVDKVIKFIGFCI